MQLLPRASLFAFSLLSLTLVMGAGCTKTNKVRDTNTYQKLSGTAQEIQFVDAKGTRFFATGSGQNYASVEYPYLVTPLDNKEAFLELHAYDLAQKKMVDGMFHEYDPMLAKIDQGRVAIAYDPNARNEQGQISLFDIAKNVLRHMPLSVSLKRLGSYAIQKDIFSLHDPDAKRIDIYDVSQPETPKMVGSVLTSGRIQNMQIAFPWVMWVEESQGTDGLLQTQIHRFNIELKQASSLPQDYRVQADLVSDGTYLAYIGNSIACHIGVKDPSTKLTADNLAENLKSTCSTGEPTRDIVVTDMSGVLVKKIPIEYGALDLAMKNGILAWSHASDETVSSPLRIRLFDIKRDNFYEHASSEKGIEYSKPLLTSDALMYLEQDRKSYQLLQDKLMYLPLDINE